MGRIIVIGDIHGCARKLEILLDKLRTDQSDRLIATGDFTSKGEDVVRSLDLWREAGGESVLGNNDAAFLRLHEQEATRSEFDESDLALLDRRDLIEWMQQWPLLIDVPEGGICVVHGGLLPGRTVSENASGDPSVLLELRQIRRTPAGWEPVDEEEDGEAFWGDQWSGASIVLYGHTPDRHGHVRVHPRALGLDTGAVYGAALTAVVIEDASARGDVASLLASGAWRLEFAGHRS